MSFTRSSSIAGPKPQNRQHFSRTKGRGRWYCNICSPSNPDHRETMPAAGARRHERTPQHIQNVQDWEKANHNSDPSPWDDLLRDVKCVGMERLELFVPFWRDGVLAAEEGKDVAKLGDFLARNHDYWATEDSWGDEDYGWEPKVGRHIAWDVDNGANAHASPAQETNPRAPGETDRCVQVGDERDEWGVNDNSGWGYADAVRGESPIVHETSPAGRRRKKAGGRGKKHDDQWDDVPDRNAWTFVEKCAHQEDASPERKQKMHQFFEMPTDRKVEKIQEMICFLRAQDRWNTGSG